MITSKFIIVILTMLFLVSCHRTYRLSERDYSWIPYKGNEILVFTSNTGDIDTISFLKKDTLIAYPEAQSLNGRTYEELVIVSKHSDPDEPSGNNHRYLENSFVELQKSKDKKARLVINLRAKDAAFYRLTGLRIDSLDKQLSTTLVTRRKTYHDVYVIDDEDWLNFKQRSNYVTKLYWSRSEGLIRYDKQGGIYWELAMKHSP